MTEVLAEAAKKNVKVIAYDRLLTNTKDVSYQATFDNHQVGVLQGKVLVERLGVDTGKDGPFRVELFAGSATDVNARSFYDGSMEVLKPYIESGQIVVPSGEIAFKKVTTKDYSDKLAQARMERLLTTYYKNRRVNAVLSPYDGMTIGIINGLKKNGYGQGNRPLPWTSGQDAEIPSVQSIIAGEQTETIFKDTRELAKVAVQMGNALLTGSKPIVNDTVSFDNGVKIVPTYLLYPVAVNETNYEGLLLKSGFYKEEQLRS
jgi:putative multiple sugar transport system substrate-binding protein